MTEVFVEQRLALPQSAINIYYSNPLQYPPILIPKTLHYHNFKTKGAIIIKINGEFTTWEVTHCESLNFLAITVQVLAAILERFKNCGGGSSIRDLIKYSSSCL